MNASVLPVPDLLRRFSAAPHCVTGCIQDLTVTLQTNDLELVSALQEIDKRSSIGSRSPSLFLKIIHDYDGPEGLSDVTLLSAWPLTTLSVGAGTVLTLDCDRREVLGFVAPSVSADRIVSELLPMLLEHLRDQEHAASGASATNGYEHRA